MFRARQIRSAQLRPLLALLATALVSTGGLAEDILVTTDADSGDGSLRQAITQAADGDRIVFDIPTPTPTILLLSDLPDISANISFANNNVDDVTIDRNGNGPLRFTGSQANPTVLVINTGGVASPDADIVATAGTTLFGNGSVTGNVTAPGALAPGASPAAGTIGTFDVAGDVDISSGRLNVDISTEGFSPASDLVNVNGTATVSAATLAPNFIGSQFQIGQQFLVLDSTSPIVGTFANQSDTFQLPNSPFLQAVENLALPADDFGFVIEDNGLPFTSVAPGCNQYSAARLLDQLLASGSTPASVTALRNGSTAEVQLAFDQLSGSIYPSLIGAEINHIQNNVESIRDLIALHVSSPVRKLKPWIRGYGVAGQTGRDNCQTLGYRQEAGGMEVGCGMSSPDGLAANVFAHLAGASVNSRGADQNADIESYRIGGSVVCFGHGVYAIAAGGGGWQSYDVDRSLSAFQGSTLVQSSFDGTAQFGYFELGYATAWTPYLAMHATRVHLDPVAETGDPDFALMNSGGSGDSLRGILGIALQQAAPTPIGPAITRLRFGWLHEYLSESETFVSQITSGSTPSTLVDRGVAPGRDWGFVRTQVEIGIVFGGQFTIAYEGQFNSRSSFNSLLLGTAWVH